MFDLFFSFFKIGAFTIGGGYVMLPLMESTCVENKKWLTHDEFMNIVVIAESTPGPIAINLATYTGYKLYKLKGGLISTLAVVLPSIIVICLIFIFLEIFLENKYIAYAFIGIRIAVSIIIINASINMFKKEEKDLFGLFIFIISFIITIISNIFSLNISIISIIIISTILAIISYLFEKNKGLKWNILSYF